MVWRVHPFFKHLGIWGVVCVCPGTAWTLRLEEAQGAMQPVAVSVVQEAQPSTYGVLSVVPLAPPPSEKQASVSTGAVFVEKRVVEEPAPVLMRGCPWKVRAVLHGERSSAVFVVAGESRIVHVGTTLSWKGQKARVVKMGRSEVWLHYRDEKVRCVLS